MLIVHILRGIYAKISVFSKYFHFLHFHIPSLSILSWSEIMNVHLRRGLRDWIAIQTQPLEIKNER